MQYAITISSFRHLESLERTVSKLAPLGFDAIEMYGEPSELNVSHAMELLKTYDLPVCGITGMWGGISSDGWKRRLLAQDSGLLKAAQQYVRDCVVLCNALGGRQLNVCLFAEEHSNIDRTHRVTSDLEKEKFVSRATPILSELCKYSKDFGVTLLLEPLNRYSTPYCATSRDAARIVKSVDNDSLKILLDTFHMNIEEDSFDGALMEAQPNLRHMHFADNNRKMPGFAHIDFEILAECVKRSGYNEFVSFEPNIPSAEYENDVKSGLEFTRNLFTG